jgi:glutamate dehydrogenase
MNLRKRSRTQRRSDVKEAVDLLRWLAADKFTFLGARDYQYVRDAKGAFTPHEPDIIESTCLGVLRDVDRYVLRTTAEPMVLTPELKRLVAEPMPLIVAKSTLRARVHRRATADYIGVKRYNEQGEATRRSPLRRPLHQRELHRADAQHSGAASKRPNG